MAGDSLGDRMKAQYENCTRFFLPRRTYTIIRVDGKAFHTFTDGFDEPFDKRLMSVMDQTAIALCKEIQGACFAYTQSDEISVLVTDFAKPSTSAWFDGNLQKMCSVAAGTATANFNREFMKANWEDAADKEKLIDVAAMLADCYRTAVFDARVFTIPDPVEVMNYFVWRQQDATRNSIQMAARAVFSHGQCENKTCSQLQDMLMTQKDINWNNYTSGEKRGRAIVKEEYLAEARNPKADTILETIRTRWVALTGNEPHLETPIFTQDRAFLSQYIPRIPDEQ